jgi:aspartyl-tRNA(Asn)/glutamyl-tRNA(Gln) amidotransferase subunit A
MARTVADAARLLEGVAGHDPDDMTSSRRSVGEYVAACRRGVGGLRIGLPREYFEKGLDAGIDAAVKAAATELQRQGASVEEVSLPHSRYAIPTYYLVATAEASSNLARYDAVRYGLRVDRGSGLRGMYRLSRGEGFGTEVKRRIMLGTYALSAGYFEAFYGKAQRVRTLLRDDFLDVFRNGIDLILCPATPTTAFRLGEKLDDPLKMYLSDVYTVTASLAGLPALALPLARSREGLPIGGQLIGPDFGEELLCRVGTTLERRFRLAPPPIADQGAGCAEGR